MNILINDPDVIYRFGMESYIKDNFFCFRNNEVSFQYELTSKNICEADVVIISINNGGQYLCSPLLCQKDSASIIIMLNADVDIKYSQLPLCYSNASFIYKNQSAGSMGFLIKKVLFATKKPHTEKSCSSCQFKKISFIQSDIVYLYYKGYTAKQISNNLSVSIKIIYTYIEKIKSYFNVRSDAELLKLMSLFKLRMTNDELPVYSMDDSQISLPLLHNSSFLADQAQIVHHPDNSGYP